MCVFYICLEFSFKNVFIFSKAGLEIVPINLEAIVQNNSPRVMCTVSNDHNKFWIKGRLPVDSFYANELKMFASLYGNEDI